MKCGLKGQQGLNGVWGGFVNEVMCEKWVQFGYAQILVEAQMGELLMGIL